MCKYICGRRDLNPRHELGKLECYQATPRPLGVGMGYDLFYLLESGLVRSSNSVLHIPHLVHIQSLLWFLNTSWTARLKQHRNLDMIMLGGAIPATSGLNTNFKKENIRFTLPEFQPPAVLSSLHEYLVSIFPAFNRQILAHKAAVIGSWRVFLVVITTKYF